jgi:hypothetical protein
MSKKSKNVELDNQPDIFGMIEKAEWQEFVDSHEAVQASDIQVGDVLRLKTWGGQTVEGKFVTKGFWDGRDRDNPTYYYVDLGDRFQQFMPNHNEWVKVGHDQTYVPPRKDDILHRLVKRLSYIPFPERLAAFQAFQKEYPYLSFEYSPHVNQAWYKAIEVVTKEQEIIDLQKHWDYTVKFPPYVLSYLEKFVFPITGEERLQALKSLRWVKNPKAQHGSFFVNYTPLKSCSYYSDLILKWIRDSQHCPNFKIFCRIMGAQSRIYREIPGLVWKEDEEGTTEVLVPLDDQPMSLFDLEEESDKVDAAEEEYLEEWDEDEEAMEVA